MARLMKTGDVSLSTESEGWWLGIRCLRKPQEEVTLIGDLDEMREGA